MSSYWWIILLFCPMLLGAQNPQLGTIHFNINNGLPSSEVHDLLQDQKGYIWIATDNGLSRFNGYHFQNFGPKSGLLSNAVFSLFSDHEDRIWMSTFGGLYFYDPIRDTIQAYLYNHIIDEYNTVSNSDLVKSFFVDKQETVYSSVSAFGVAIINCDGTHRLLEKVEDYSLFIFQQDHHTLIAPFTPLPNNGAKDFSRTKVSQLLLYRSKETDHSTIILDKDPLIPYSHYQSASTLASDHLLFSMDHNLYLIHQNKVEFIGALPKVILAQTQTEDQAIYLGLSKNQEEGGVAYYPSEDALYENPPLRYLNEYSVTDILEDRKG